MDHRRGFLRYYRGAALLLLNTVVLLVAVNVGLALLFRVKDAWTRRQAAKNVSRVHSNPSLHTVYPGMDAQSIDQLLRESWSRPYDYEPYTQFRERPFRGRFVNVAEAGYRYSRDQGSWPPAQDQYTVFVFGGSTTFGYGLPDDQTVPSFLQEDLRRATDRNVRVYNFGRSSYVSGQERALFEQLLIEGHVPDLAIFIDGLNEFAFPEGPAETPHLEAVFGTRRPALEHLPAISGLPMTRFARFLRRGMHRVVHGSPPPAVETVQPLSSLEDERHDDPDGIARIVNRYESNRRLIEAIAEKSGVRVAFVWQPIPLYKYDLHYHLFATGDFGSNLLARHGYRYVAQRMRETPPDGDFLWCADMQEGLQEPLYVDKVHYTARMSGMVAKRVCDLLIDRGIVSPAPQGVAPEPHGQAVGHPAAEHSGGEATRTGGK